MFRANSKITSNKEESSILYEKKWKQQSHKNIDKEIMRTPERNKNIKEEKNEDSEEYENVKHLYNYLNVCKNDGWNL